MFTAESDGERILKIGQHMAKLWTRVVSYFFDSRGSSKSSITSVAVVLGISRDWPSA